MISNSVNTTRVLKAFYDLSSSQKAFYVNSRAELRDGVSHSIKQFRSRLSESPKERPPLARKPFKMLLFFLLALCLPCITLAGPQ
jgi:hypothetical protein